jgi:hypothetical protein
LITGGGVLLVPTLAGNNLFTGMNTYDQPIIMKDQASLPIATPAAGYTAVFTSNGNITTITSNGNICKLGDLAPSEHTSNYTITLLDDNVPQGMNKASAIILYVPIDTVTVNFTVGTAIPVIAVGTGEVSVQAVTPWITTINSTGVAPTAPILRAQFSGAVLYKYAANTWYVMGDIR